MKNEFIRTGKTNLADDELILFDALFDSSCPIEQLKSKGFNERFNLGYQHNLTDPKLLDCLENLKSQKLIRIKTSKSQTSFIELTAKGGKLWEKERESIWEKYCEGYFYSPSKIKNEMLWEIVSPSKQTLKNYLEKMEIFGLHGFSENHEVEFFSEKRKFIVGLNWKRFDDLFFATVTGVYDDSVQNDWDKYYDVLDWWGNIHELNLLKQNNK